MLAGILKPYFEWRIRKLAQFSRFCFIATTPRTGSNYLTSMLNETHLLGYGREFFSRSVTIEQYPNRRPTILRQVRHSLESGQTPNGITTVKLHPNQFERVCSYVNLTNCFPDCRWIWLRRKDVLGQAISHEIAHQTGAWISNRSGNSSAEYSKSSINRRIEEIENANRIWSEYFVENKIEPLCLWYEDICERPEYAVDLVKNLLDVKIWPLQMTEKRSNRYAGIKKQETETNKIWAARFQSESSK